MKAKVYSKKQLEDMDAKHMAAVANPLPSWARTKLGDPKKNPYPDQAPPEAQDYARGGMVKKGRKC